MHDALGHVEHVARRHHEVLVRVRVRVRVGARARVRRLRFRLRVRVRVRVRVLTFAAEIRRVVHRVGVAPLDVPAHELLQQG